MAKPERIRVVDRWTVGCQDLREGIGGITLRSSSTRGRTRGFIEIRGYFDADLVVADLEAVTVTQRQARPSSNRVRRAVHEYSIGAGVGNPVLAVAIGDHAMATREVAVRVGQHPIIDLVPADRHIRAVQYSRALARNRYPSLGDRQDKHRLFSTLHNPRAPPSRRRPLSRAPPASAAGNVDCLGKIALEIFRRSFSVVAPAACRVSSVGL